MKILSALEILFKRNQCWLGWQKKLVIKRLFLALKNSTSRDLLMIIREYDSSKESIVNLLVTPDQFARAVVLEREIW